MLNWACRAKTLRIVCQKVKTGADTIVCTPFQPFARCYLEVERHLRTHRPGRDKVRPAERE